MEIQQSDLLNTLNQAAQSQLIFVNFHFALFGFQIRILTGF